MHKIVHIISIILIFYQYGMAQQLTKQQALKVANQLAEIELLSKYGNSELKQLIEAEELENGLISKNTIIKFCAEAFQAENTYRSGLNSYSFISNSLIQELGKPQNDIQQQQFNTLLQQRIDQLQGPQIEALIETEDSLPQHQGSWTASPPLNKIDTNYISLIHNNRSALGKHRTKTLYDLLNVGLINQQLFDDGLFQIKRQNVIFESHLLAFLYRRSLYYADYKKNKIAQIKLLESLQAADIIEPDSLKKCLDSYQPLELKEKFEFLSYCNNAKVFHTTSYNQNPQIGFQKIFEEIRSIIPNFAYKNLAIELDTIDVEYTEDKELFVTISFQHNNQEYRHRFFQSFIFNKSYKQKKYANTLSINSAFYQGINKMLADKNSSYRLYFANKKEDRSTYNKNVFGLILLTEKQRRIWGNDPYFLSKELHNNQFNTQKLLAIIDTYQTIGLFNHLSKAQINSGKLKVLESSIYSYQAILACFPELLVPFYWESDNLKNPYEDLTMQFSQVSHGAFLPTNIIDNFKDNLHQQSKSTNYAFVLEGQAFDTKLELNNSWLDPYFLSFINNALAQQKVDGKFYDCSKYRKPSTMLFLTSKQFQYLKKHQPELFIKSKD